MSDIRISISPLGATTLSVGGVEVEHVKSVAVSAIPGDLSRLWVELVAPDNIDVDMNPAEIFYGYDFEEGTN